MYQQWFKRPLDILLSGLALLVLWPVIAALAILVRVKLGAPVIFKQKRPGMKDKYGVEKIFTLYKFRTMTDERDAEGKLLPDEQRLPRFGQRLRDTSLDELPELWNILKGDMSVVGPRPLLVRDMLFMTDEERKRHYVRPGLSGLAQINGRNCIEWEEKLDYDLNYVKKINLIEDIRIILVTMLKVFKTESISYEGMATAEDLGDYLLRKGKVDKVAYDQKQEEALRYSFEIGINLNTPTA